MKKLPQSLAKNVESSIAPPHGVLYVVRIIRTEAPLFLRDGFHIIQLCTQKPLKEEIKVVVFEVGPDSRSISQCARATHGSPDYSLKPLGEKPKAHLDV